ncbi:aminoglycoside phosphotransferase family protein [Streptomyces incanus]
MAETPMLSCAVAESVALVQAALATVRELAHHQPDTLILGDLNARNILAGTREPWLAVDPKGWVGDRAYDCGTLTKSRSVVLAEQGDLSRGIRRTLDAFTNAAELDRERARRWAQLSAVQAAYGGRRRGFRRGRHGAERALLVALVDELTRILTGV